MWSHLKGVWPFATIKQYKALPKDDEDLRDRPLPDEPRQPRSMIRYVLLLAFSTTLVVSIILVSWAVSRGVKKGYQDTQSFPELPSNVSLRREWRTLSRSQQSHYIDSVRCLLTVPSEILNNSTRYTDFPFIHSHVGWYTHHAAAFLPWHRYFLHIYENTLRDACGYTGALTYWDWTLDSSDVASSVVFDAKTGFGGDGERSGEITVGTTGHCLKNGPFKDVIADFYDTSYQPHCLSRGFHDDTGKLGHIDGKDISPKSIQGVLKLDDYESFVNALESKVHDAIPFGLGGDFETFTAPYDPLFFLHHTQLDRLWFLWQQQDPGNRTFAYGGHSSRHTMNVASLDDKLKMGGLGPSISVRQIMDTEGEMLSYRY